MFDVLLLGIINLTSASNTFALRLSSSAKVPI